MPEPGSVREAGAFVFAPAMFLTVTLESGREADQLHLHAGGQGIWIGRMLSTLGVDVVLCAPFGGETGLVARLLTTHEGLDVRGVDVGSETGAYVHDRRSGDRRVVGEMPPQPLTRHELDELYGAAVVAALEEPVSVLGGPHDPSPVPPDVYRRLAKDVRSDDRRVVVDLSGEPLDAALSSGVDVLKISDEELVGEGRARTEALPDLVDAGRSLQRRGATHVAVSRGASPALLLTGGDAYEIVGPELEPADTGGAGDSMTAGIAAGIATGLGVVDAVRLGVAAGTLNASRHGRGSGERDQVERLTSRIEARPLAGA